MAFSLLSLGWSSPNPSLPHSSVPFLLTPFHPRDFPFHFLKQDYFLFECMCVRVCNVFPGEGLRSSGAEIGPK